MVDQIEKICKQMQQSSGTGINRLAMEHIVVNAIMGLCLYGGCSYVEAKARLEEIRDKGIRPLKAD